MNRTVLLSAITAALVSVAGMANAQNLVQNGNFAGGGAFWASGNVGFGQFGDSDNTPNFGSPVAYSNGFAFWNDGPRATLDQTIATAMGGWYYFNVSVYAPIDGTPSGLLMDVGGTNLVSLSAPNMPYGGWTNYSGGFYADGNNDDLHLEWGSDSSNYWNIGVTNVVVQSVPEPCSMLALGIPAAGLLLRRKKK